MDEFFPSEIARLVLGYLKDVKCLESWETFLRESSDLYDYRFHKEGKFYTTNVNGKSLLEILTEYPALKSESINNEKNKTKNNSQNSHTENAFLAKRQLLQPMDTETSLCVQSKDASAPKESNINEEINDFENESKNNKIGNSDKQVLETSRVTQSISSKTESPKKVGDEFISYLPGRKRKLSESLFTDTCSTLTDCADLEIMTPERGEIFKTTPFSSNSSPLARKKKDKNKDKKLPKEKIEDRHSDSSAYSSFDKASEKIIVTHKKSVQESASAQQKGMDETNKHSDVSFSGDAKTSYLIASSSKVPLDQPKKYLHYENTVDLVESDIGRSNEEGSELANAIAYHNTQMLPTSESPQKEKEEPGAEKPSEKLETPSKSINYEKFNEILKKIATEGIDSIYKIVMEKASKS